jgi:AraC family transcriptional regulator of adaptative response / DNA-3-methyladenine glycosylase II
MAVRAVVGQQISVAGARKVLARLASGAPGQDPLDHGVSARKRADHDVNFMIGEKGGLVGFPRAEDVLDAPDDAFGMPAARRRTLRMLAEAVASGHLRLDPGADRAETESRLLAIPGVGPWTAQYVALRALGDPDVLLATDLGVRRGAAALGLSGDPADLAAHADRHWAPWRSYATIRLWRQA